MIYYSMSESETEKIAEDFSHQLKSGDIVALFGTLGMGKTAFVRGIARGLLVKDTVQSPTFSIINEYRGCPPLAHFDMYRINSWDDLEQTGFFDYIENGAIVVTEWSENIENALPEKYIKVEILLDDRNEMNCNNRKIIITDSLQTDSSQTDY